MLLTANDSENSSMSILSTVIVLSAGHTASTDYYIFPHLKQCGYQVELCDSRLPPENQPHILDADLVVISRYLPPAWLKTLISFKEKGGKIAYFMDDDLFDTRVWHGLPWRYRWRIWRNATSQKDKLQKLASEFWVSTRYLEKKYSHLYPILLNPHASEDFITSKPLVKICYHGTASHLNEINWLVEVMETVQSESLDTHFEIFGGDQVRKYFKGIPRVSVIHPMSWSDYHSWSSSEYRDIGLAPLLSSDFNKARGPTKFIDYTRIGAAGIYSNVFPYEGYVNDGVDGVLVDNAPALWVEEIINLVNELERRKAYVSAAHKRLLECGKD